MPTRLPPIFALDTSTKAELTTTPSFFQIKASYGGLIPDCHNNGKESDHHNHVCCNQLMNLLAFLLCFHLFTLTIMLLIFILDNLNDNKDGHGQRMPAKEAAIIVFLDGSLVEFGTDFRLSETTAKVAKARQLSEFAGDGGKGAWINTGTVDYSEGCFILNSDMFCHLQGYSQDPVNYDVGSS
ncbi:hypothetical protein MKW98_000625 [Papaver atlanticum]|uniref:Uncharacterized protein n=1 Tax=Papaver atlanticum TaxID=357466 RepID=A0AAD4S4D8_9MAGN|nr:hypothetical protein MKW98_000625 [Papaver atlanticum]